MENISLEQQMPAPPRMHWAVLFLICVVTLGLFGSIWLIRQCNWVKRVKGSCRAIKWAYAYAGLLVFVFFGAIALELLGSGPNSLSSRLLDVIARLCGGILFLTAAFSLRNELEESPINIPLGGVMTFFFNIVYFQYHLRDYHIDEISIPATII